MCIGPPLPVQKWQGEGPIPEEMIEELHKKYLNAIILLFDTYKQEAGYPDGILEVL